MSLRLGILGSRFAATLHAQAAARVPSVSLVGVSSRDSQRAAEFAQQSGARRHWSKPEELIESDELDAVCLCVPTFLHHQYAIATARAGKHVICEKPLATTLEDAEEMIAACREHGVRLCYAEDWLFAPALLRAKELIEEGAIGRLLAMRARECHSGSHSPFARRRETCGGGAMIHLGAHPIAAARWLVEDEPVAVTASFSGGGDSNLLHPDFEGEDWGVVIVEFEHGARATIEANYITLGGRNDVVEICGTEGFLKVDLTLGSPIQAFSRSGLNYAVEKADTTIGWTRPAVDELVEHGFVNQMAHFADCIMQGNEPKAGTRGEDGRTVLRIALTATESASSGKRVHL